MRISTPLIYVQSETLIFLFFFFFHCFTRGVMPGGQGQSWEGGLDCLPSVHICQDRSVSLMSCKMTQLIWGSAGGRGHSTFFWWVCATQVSKSRVSGGSRFSLKNEGTWEQKLWKFTSWQLKFWPKQGWKCSLKNSNGGGHEWCIDGKLVG